MIANFIWCEFDIVKGKGHALGALLMESLYCVYGLTYVYTSYRLATLCSFTVAANTSSIGRALVCIGLVQDVRVSDRVWELRHRQTVSVGLSACSGKPGNDTRTPTIGNSVK